MTYLGIDGGIGRLRTPTFDSKETGTKVYTKTFGRMALDGTIISNARSYAGKTSFDFTISGGVQSEGSTVAGNINRTANQTLSGAVQSQSPTMFGVIAEYTILSGAVSAQSATVSGTVAKYPLTGWALTDFTTNYAGLDADSPFAGDANYSAIVSGDKCHHETTTPEDGLTISMNGLGEFTATGTITQANTFDVQIYDASDGTFGAIAEITVYPGAADETLSGAVTAQSATMSGSLNSFTVYTLSGAVQSDSATMAGVINTGDIHLLVGNVSSQSATVAGDVEVVSTLSGAVQAQSATVSGAMNRVIPITGGIQAQAPVISGLLIRQRAHTLAPAIRTTDTRADSREITVKPERRSF